MLRTSRLMSATPLRGVDPVRVSALAARLRSEHPETVRAAVCQVHPAARTWNLWGDSAPVCAGCIAPPPKVNIPAG